MVSSAAMVPCSTAVTRNPNKPGRRPAARALSVARSMSARSMRLLVVTGLGGEMQSVTTIDAVPHSLASARFYVVHETVGERGDHARLGGGFEGDHADGETDGKIGRCSGREQRRMQLAADARRAFGGRA